MASPANLFMFAIFAAGLVSLTGLEREAWPTIPFNHIEVSIAYPGATPEEIEESIIAKVEEQVSSLDDVLAVKSMAAPGIASVRIEVKSGTDIPLAVDEIESAVDRIQSFPTGSERPQIAEMTSRQSIIRLVLYGDIPERSLKELAYQVEDELASLPTVSLTETSGVRNYEISIEVPLNRLRALGLTLDDVAAAIRRSSLDLSAGRIDTSDAQVRVRTLGQRYVQQDFEDIVVLGRSDGTAVRLGDIAEVRDDFQNVDLIVRHEGKPAAFVEVSRVEGEHVMDVANAVHAHVANVIAPSLPEGVEVDILNDESQVYAERANLLLKNGGLGLLLVLVSLALFLEIRLAVWVVVGLATSFVGTLAVMLLLGVALNTISLFVFVLAIGIIVDDAIVVAEHIHLERDRGTPGVVAAIRGARRIKIPLTFAVLTSVVAFTPVFFVPGGIGEIWRALPIMIIAMLLISLFESLLILPNHLSHLHGPEWVPANGFDRFFARTQGYIDRQLAVFLDGPLDRALRFATGQPAITIAGAVALLILSVSLLPAGIVTSTFADVVEGDFVTATLEMPDGTTAERTYAVARDLEAAGHRVIERFASDRPDDSPPLLSGVTLTVGRGTARRGRGTHCGPHPESRGQYRRRRVQTPGRAAAADHHRGNRAGVARGGRHPAPCARRRLQRPDHRPGKSRRSCSVAPRSGTSRRDCKLPGRQSPGNRGGLRRTLGSHPGRQRNPARGAARSAHARNHRGIAGPCRRAPRSSVRRSSAFKEAGTRCAYSCGCRRTSAIPLTTSNGTRSAPPMARKSR